MRNRKLAFVFLVLFAVFFSSAEANVFSENFDGDISDWTITPQGLGSFTTSTANSVSAPCSFYMDSMGNSQAMAVSPTYDVNLSENYHVSFYFLIPIPR